MTQRIIPTFWCDGDAEEAGAFYESVFGDARSSIVARYPETGLPPAWQERAGSPLVVDVALTDDFRITLVNAGSNHTPTTALSFLVSVDPRRFGGDERAARAWINRAWTLLGEQDRVVVDIGSYSFSALYGWVEDRYGVSWQLKLLPPGAEPVPRFVPMLTFGDAAGAQARPAIELYTSLFPDSGIGESYPYVVFGTGEEIIYTEFHLCGQPFSAMASPEDQDAVFTPGASLLVRCDDQAEIDHLWEGLSAVPEAEVRGRLIDRFGMSWEIVPVDLAALLERPGAYEHLEGMTRIVIDEL